ncbi:MAG: hypothetical protein AB7H86_11590 [Blastocatellales bacterium]
MAEQSLSQHESREALARVLASKYFVNAPMKQKFLTTICEFQLSGRGEDLNEFLIGHEVFGRDDTYNPATDPIVRVSAHGVRYKLESYYQKEGAGDRIRIELPPGKYAPRFVRNNIDLTEIGIEETEGTADQDLSTSPGNGLSRLQNLWPWALILILLVAVALLGYSNYRYRTAGQIGEVDDVVQGYWEGLLANGSPTLVVLSNPAVFRFVNAADPETIVQKAIPLNQEQNAEISARLRNKNLLRIATTSRLTLTSNIYTGLGEALGLSNLTGVFTMIGREMQVKQSRTVSAEDLKNHNVIILGTIWVNDWSAKLPLSEDFVYTDSVTIRNLNPKPGEAVDYKARFDSQTGEIIEDYAMITLGRNISGNEWFMLVGGLHSEGTAAAAEYLTKPYHLRKLNQLLSSEGNPKYYQALLKVGVENAIPTTIDLVTIHQLK